MQAKSSQEKAKAEDIRKRIAVLRTGKVRMDRSVADLRNEVATLPPSLPPSLLFFSSSRSLPPGSQLSPSTSSFWR